MARRAILWTVMAAALVLAATHVHDLVSLGRTFVSGDFRWLGLALVFQVAYYAGYIATFHAGSRSVGVRRSFGEFVAPVFGSIFVNTVAPTGGAAGQALLVDDAVRHGHPPSRSTAALLVADAADLGGFSVILLVGVGYLAVAHRLDAAEVAASLVVLAAVGLFVGLLVMGLVRPMLVGSLFSRLERFSAWVLGVLRRTPPEPWAETAAREWVEASRLLAERPSGPLTAFVFALAGHAADVVSFVCVGYAFGVTAPAPLLAAYAVSVLFWIVAVVPQGVGVSEGAGALVLRSFGVAAPQTLAVALVFRGISFWIPFAIGAVLIRRAGGVSSTVRSASADTRVVRIATVGALVAGAVNIVSAVTPNLATRIQSLGRGLPIQVHYGHLAAALAGIALLYLAHGLHERKRAAWWLALAVLGASTVVHIAKGLDFEEAAVAAALFVWLATKRDVFHARSDTPSAIKGLRSLVTAFALTLVYGAVGFFLLDGHFSIRFGVLDALEQTAAMFFAFRDPGLAVTTRFGQWFVDSIYVIGAVTLGHALLQLLRPVVSRSVSSTAEVDRARRIAEEWGSGSLARVAVLPDKSFFFTEGGSVVCYAARGGVAIALGDPIGPDDDAVDAIGGFAGMCTENGWEPVFYQTTPRLLDRYHEAGFRDVRIGHEAVVDVRAFSLTGKSHKSMRNRINRLAEEGYVTQVVDPPLSDGLLGRLREVSDAWLTGMHGTEKRFSLGWFDDAYIRECVVFVVTDGAGEVVAFANLLPEYRLNEATIDLMRHVPSAPSGTMDLMFVRLFEWAAEHGYDTFNLGLAPLSGVGDEPSDPLLEKAMRLAYEHANAFYSFKGLREYKEKFEPEWQVRYLVYRTGVNPVEVIAALAMADSGGNLIAEYGHDLLRRLQRA